MLFYKEHLKKASITDNSETKEFYRRQWDNMSDKKKVIWINWAAEEEAKYKVMDTYVCTLFAILIYFLGRIKAVRLTTSRFCTSTY